MQSLFMFGCLQLHRDVPGAPDGAAKVADLIAVADEVDVLAFRH